MRNSLRELSTVQPSDQTQEIDLLLIILSDSSHLSIPLSPLSTHSLAHNPNSSSSSSSNASRFEFNRLRALIGSIFGGMVLPNDDEVAVPLRLGERLALALRLSREKERKEDRDENKGKRRRVEESRGGG
jgi:hypothetical protein